MSEAVGYSGSDFKVNFSTQDVDKGFSSFNDLTGADKTQMATQSGIRRTNYGIQFKTGLGPGGNNWNNLNIAQFDSDTGRLQTEATNFDFGALKFQADIRSVDSGFNRMSALSDAERTNMALTVRRMFDPNAQASNVTAQDKGQITGESGLDRSNYRIDYASGAVHTALSISDISSSTGGLVVPPRTSWAKISICMSLIRVSTMASVGSATCSPWRWRVMATSMVCHARLWEAR